MSWLSAIRDYITGAKTQASQNIALNSIRIDGTLTTTQPGGPSSFPPLMALRTAVNNVISGTADAYMCLRGDSTTVGYQAGNTPAGYTAAYVNSYPLVLATQLTTSLGIQVNTDALIGDRNLFENAVTNYNTYDSRVNTPGGWNLATTGNFSLGGNPFINQTTTDAFTYTPTLPFNALDIFYNTTNAGGGAANVNVNGVQVGTFSCAAAPSMARLTITGLTLQSQAISIVPTSNSVFVAAIVPRNTSIKQLYLHVIASASAIANQETGTYGLSQFYTASGYPYCAGIISFGTNEANSGGAVGPSLFEANLTFEYQALQAQSYATPSAAPVNSVATGCDIIFSTGPPINPAQSGGADAAIQDRLYNSMADLNPAMFPFLNQRYAVGATYVAAVANGYMENTDNFHYIKKGYAFWGQRLNSLIQDGIWMANKQILY